MVEIKDWIQVLDFHHFGDKKSSSSTKETPQNHQKEVLPSSLSLSLMKSSYFSGKIHI
jgi:hypothetical protein